MNRIKFLLLVIITFSYVFIIADESTVTLEKVWSTAPDLSTPESVIYDAVDSVLYVSNIDGDPLTVDSSGFISRVDLNGKILQLKWITGLNAPKGMGILGGTLYVADLTELVEIDISLGKIIQKYPIPDAKIANDVTVGDRGEVFISETAMGNDTIYRFSEGSVEKWHYSKNIERPNGLLAIGNDLFVGSSGTKSIALINIEKNKLIKKIKVKSIIDGIVKLDEDRLIFSDWYGKLFLLENFKDVSLIIDTIPFKQNAADIFYAKELELLLVPTFFDDRIIAYRIIENN